MIPSWLHPVGTPGAGAALVVLLAASQQAFAQQPAVRPYTLPGSAVHRLESQAVGDTFEISVALPLGYEQTDGSYPVVIAMDADLAFAATAQIARLMQLRQELPEFVLVGVGYGDLAVALEKRRRDLTPTVDEGNPACDADGACGGAQQFARFIESELLPFVTSRYRVDPADRTLIGNSLGGLFGCYVLLREPRLFGRYLLGSPSVSWDGGWALATVRRPGIEGDLDARVYVGVGGEESNAVAGARDFVEQLRMQGLNGLSLTFRIFDGERHMSVQPMVVTRGLRVLFGTASGGVPRSRSP
jgi:predicted alpha/beta superfamily hydrolase